ncbi:MAG: allophanate hydrolase [Arcobacter sp.]|nr:allophanate hydrolase [Arcobacter sp.]|tara:strand:+ start:1544 stop:2218 length:675 start_codon:yes stop_codon:yes gene_type:complete
MDFKVASVDSIIIYFGREISQEISLKVKKAYKSIMALKDESLIEIIPSYNSIFITYDIFTYDFVSLKQKIERSITFNSLRQDDEKIVSIDVYYGVEVGFDLEDISKKTSLSIEEIISLHSSKIYDVYAIGFLPGFAYLGNVDKKIAMPRLSSPRKKVPKGSLALADTQTAIYPQDSAGGWNIIGKTAMELFDKSLDTLSPLSGGNRVRFNPITKEEFLKQGGIL